MCALVLNVDSIRLRGLLWCKRRPSGCFIGARAGCFVPYIRTDTAKIVDDLAVLQRQFAEQFRTPVQPSIDHIGEAKLSLFPSQNSNVGDLTLGKTA